MCAEGMGCGRKWATWVLQGTGTASWRAEVTWMISQTMHWLSQPTVFSKMGQSECRQRIGDGGYNISIGRIYRRGRVPLCGLDGEDWPHGDFQKIMNIRSPQIYRWVRRKSWSCWRVASHRTCRSPFANIRTSFCTFSNASALHRIKNIPLQVILSSFITVDPEKRHSL